MTLRAVLLAVFLPLSAASAQDLSGTWTAKDVTITLSQDADQLSGSIVTDRKSISIGGVVEGSQAFGEVTGPNGTAPFTLSLTGQAMKFEMTGPDGKTLKFFLKRSKPGAVAAAAPTEPPEPAPAPPLPAGKGAAPAKGGLWKNENEGWSLNSPAGWKGGEKDGALLLGHDTEWGALRVSHQLGAKLEEMRAQGENGFTFDGVMFTPTTPLTFLKVKAGTALVGDYQGETMQGPTRVHSVALQGPMGVLLISGIAPASNFGKLAQHTEAMAASVTFFKGKAGNAAQHVAGTWWHWRGSSNTTYGSTSGYSGYSAEKKLWLCPDGRFSRTGSFSVDVSTRTETDSHISSAGASHNSNNGADGRWTAIGTPQAGKIIVTLNDGSRQELSYQRAAQGDAWQLYIDGTGYLYDNKMGGCD